MFVDVMALVDSVCWLIAACEPDGRDNPAVHRRLCTTSKNTL